MFEYMPLLDLIQRAQQLEYWTPPGKTQITEYTEEEIFEAMMHRMLQDPTVVYGLITGCRKYIVIKLLVKQLLSRYVNKYSRGSGGLLTGQAATNEAQRLVH